ncbi:MAG: hypothetical protein AAFO77_05500 [Pseudomonadota bacterium]
MGMKTSGRPLRRRGITYRIGSVALLSAAFATIAVSSHLGGTAMAQTRDAIIVTSNNPLSPDDRTRLSEAGLEVGNLISENRYFGSLPSEADANEAVRDELGTFGLEIAEVPLQVKLEPVTERLGDTPGGEIEVMVRPSPGTQEADALLALREIDPNARISSKRRAILLTVSANQLPDLAAIDFVEQVEPNAGFPILQ